MARLLYECFCTLIYDAELTYEEVLEREEQVKEAMQMLLLDSGAVHIDFVPLSDSLQVQWAFAELSEDDWKNLCTNIAELAVSGVQAKTLLVDRNLEELQLAYLAHGKALLTRQELPPPDEALTTRKFSVAVVKK